MEIILQFSEGRKPPFGDGKPIARVNSDKIGFFSRGHSFVEGFGKVALINKKYNGVLPQVGETWLCRVDFEKPKFAVVTPIRKLDKVEVEEVYPCGRSKMTEMDARLFLRKEYRNTFTMKITTTECDKCSKLRDTCKIFEVV